MEQIQTMILSKYGEQLNKIGYAIMAGKFDITEISHNGSHGYLNETEIVTSINGHKVTIKLVGVSV